MKGGRQRFTDLGIRLIGRLLPLLERLSIHEYDSPISCAAVISVFRSCVKMNSIDLGEIFDNFSNSELIRLQEFGHLFEGLYFAGKLEEIRKGFDNQGPNFKAMHFTHRREKIEHFVRLLSCCPQLSTLTCNNLYQATPDAVGDTLIMSTAAETCCDLKVLDLSYFNFSTTPIGIFLNLREIRLSDCKDIPVSVFETIITMEKLEVFYVDSCTLFDADASIELLSRGCPNLKDLRICPESSEDGDVSGKIFPEGLLILLMSHYQRLERVIFDLDFDMIFSPDGHRHNGAAMEIAEALSLCPLLRKISVQVMRRSRFVFNDQCLSVLCGRCTQLEAIHLVWGLETMNDRGFGTESLLELNRQDVTINGVHALASACPSLRTIQLGVYSGPECDDDMDSGYGRSFVDFFPAPQKQLLKAQFPRLVVKGL